MITSNLDLLLICMYSGIVILLITICRHQKKTLKKKDEELEDYRIDSKKVRESYNASLEFKNKELLLLENLIKSKDNEIKSWKDASDLKQQYLDKINYKFNIIHELIIYLSANWNKHLVIQEAKNTKFIFPALRLTINDKNEYDVKSYQGSKDLNNHTFFRLELEKDKFTSLDSILTEILHSHTPNESKIIDNVKSFLINYNNGRTN